MAYFPHNLIKIEYYACIKLIFTQYGWLIIQHRTYTPSSGKAILWQNRRKTTERARLGGDKRTGLSRQARLVFFYNHVNAQSLIFKAVCISIRRAVTRWKPKVEMRPTVSNSTRLIGGCFAGGGEGSAWQSERRAYSTQTSYRLEVTVSVQQM